ASDTVPVSAAPRGSTSRTVSRAKIDDGPGIRCGRDATGGRRACTTCRGCGRAFLGGMRRGPAATGARTTGRDTSGECTTRAPVTGAPVTSAGPAAAAGAASASTATHTMRGPRGRSNELDEATTAALSRCGSDDVSDVTLVCGTRHYSFV